MHQVFLVLVSSQFLIFSSLQPPAPGIVPLSIIKYKPYTERHVFFLIFWHWGFGCTIPCLPQNSSLNGILETVFICPELLKVTFWKGKTNSSHRLYRANCSYFKSYQFLFSYSHPQGWGAWPLGSGVRPSWPLYIFHIYIFCGNGNFSRTVPDSSFSLWPPASYSLVENGVPYSSTILWKLSSRNRVTPVSIQDRVWHGIAFAALLPIPAAMQLCQSLHDSLNTIKHC